MNRLAFFLASSLSVLAGIAAAQDGDREADARARAAEEVGNVEAACSRAGSVANQMASLNRSLQDLERWFKDQKERLGRSSNLDDLKTRLAEKASEISDLRQKKFDELDDLRKGRFCRACKQTRTQIERTGENWQKHLNDNSEGVPVGATPEEIAACEAKYDSMIAPLEKEVRELQTRIETTLHDLREAESQLSAEYNARSGKMKREIWDLKQELDDLSEEILEAAGRWRSALAEWNRRLVDRIRAALSAKDEALEDLKNEIYRAENRARYAHDKGLDGEEAKERALMAVYAGKYNEVRRDIERFVLQANQSVTEWEETRRDQAARVQQAFGESGVALPYTDVTGHWPQFGIPGVPVEFGPGPRLEIGAGFGEFGLSMEAEFDPVLGTGRLSVMLEGPGGLGGIGLEQTNGEVRPLVKGLPDGVVESTPGQREATPGRRDLEKSLEGKGTPPGKGDLNRELEGKR